MFYLLLAVILSGLFKLATAALSFSTITGTTYTQSGFTYTIPDNTATYVGVSRTSYSFEPAYTSTRTSGIITVPDHVFTYTITPSGLQALSFAEFNSLTSYAPEITSLSPAQVSAFRNALSSFDDAQYTAFPQREPLIQFEQDIYSSLKNPNQRGDARSILTNPFLPTATISSILTNISGDNAAFYSEVTSILPALRSWKAPLITSKGMVISDALQTSFPVQDFVASASAFQATGSVPQGTDSPQETGSGRESASSPGSGTRTSSSIAQPTSFKASRLDIGVFVAGVAVIANL